MALIITTFLSSLLIRHVTGRQVVLLDSSKLSSLGWKTWSGNGEDDASGWLEESVLYNVVQDSLNSRSYVACDIKKPHVDNWLQLPLIERSQANRLFIEISFTVRACKESDAPLVCKEIFSLLYRETDAKHDFSALQSGASSINSFLHLATITADPSRLIGRQELRINKEIKSIPVTKHGVYFAFHDEGACVSLLNVKIYYEVCEKSIVNFALFPETPVGSNFSSVIPVNGQCLENAAPYFGSEAGLPLPRRVCKADGHWDLTSGGCHCRSGYRPDGKDKCTACPIDYYKDSPGFGACLPCPRSSRAPNNASTFCSCDSGSFRAPEETRSAPCTRLPSKPENLKLTSADGASADFSWSPPSDFGGRSEIWYKVECSDCPARVLYEPSQNRRINSTSVRVRNLEPGQKYTLFVYAMNALTFNRQAEPLSFASLKFSTPLVNRAADKFGNSRILGSGRNKMSLLHNSEKRITENANNKHEADKVKMIDDDPGAPRLWIDSVTENQISLAWEDSEEASLILSAQSVYKRRYEIEMKCGAGVSNELTRFRRVETTDQSKLTFSNLIDGAEYEFRIRSMLRDNIWTGWSSSLTVKTNFTPSSFPEQTGAIDSAKIIWISISILLLLLLVAAFYCNYRKLNPRTLRTLFNKSELVPSRRLNSQSEFEYKGFSVATSLAPCFAPALKRARTFQPYIDPSNYDDPGQVLHEFVNEIDPSLISIEEIIGSGEFGDVCRGSLKIHFNTGCHQTVAVAVKTLKFGSSAKAKKDFLSEAFIMGQFQHPNVVGLIGVVSKNDLTMIISEFMQNGSLVNFLKGKEDMLHYTRLTYMLREIALGMKYLTDKRYIHRDLAARNVLVNAHLVCKIADFGLSRFANSVDRTYTTNGGKIPVRWTAPEAISLREFTAASDVWSFGVCSWETMSYGKRPYGNWPNEEVISRVENGYRLQRPQACPEPVYNLMQSCWRQQREARPTFSAICKTLDDILHNAMPLCESLPFSECCRLRPMMDNSACTASATVHYNTVVDQQNLPALLGRRRTSSNADGSRPGSATALIMSSVDVDQFLRTVGLYEKYSGHLRRHGIVDSFALRQALGSGQLGSMGVTVDDQQKMLFALQQLDRLSAMS